MVVTAWMGMSGNECLCESEARQTPEEKLKIHVVALGM